MKGLLDIQQDIRNIEANINDLCMDLRNAYADIDALRNAGQKSDVDYEEIEALAKQLPFGKHPIDSLEDGRACQLYLELLLNIIRIDEDSSINLNRLVFAQWLVVQSRIDMDLEALYTDSLGFEYPMILELEGLLTPKYKENFMVDALVMSNFSGTANKEILSYVVDICAAFGMEHEQMSILSAIAKVILEQSIAVSDNIDFDDFMRKLGGFRHYIPSSVISEANRKLRRVVVEVKDADIRSYKWKIKQGEKVRKGDVLFVYNSRGGYSYRNSENEIKAPRNGTIYTFRDNNTNYGVISHQADDKDSIKAWVKENRR